MSLISLHFKQVQKPIAAAGFGIIELLVSISIMIIISSVILVQQSSFNGAVLLRGQAYEIALAAREVQLNAVSINDVTGDFRSLLGLHFDLNNNQEYKIFRDADNDGFYDSSEVFGRQGNLDGRFEIREIRVNQNVGGEVPRTPVSVVFERPNFDARFFGSTGEINASSIEIDVAKKGVPTSVDNPVRTLEITSTGQITVQCVVGQSNC